DVCSSDLHGEAGLEAFGLFLSAFGFFFSRLLLNCPFAISSSILHALSRRPHHPQPMCCASERSSLSCRATGEGIVHALVQPANSVPVVSFFVDFEKGS